MKLGALLTSLIFVFGCTTELLAQFVPVIAKQRSVHFLIQTDGTEVEEVSLEVYASENPLSQRLGAAGFRSVRRGALPDVAGRRLDGVEERLSDYRGRIVLLDFWATWCGPCVAALPKLRELVATLPADRFALVGISVDEELETVTRFIEDQPMPWTIWHVGEGSDLERLLRIRGYPTYVLADENGSILARTNGLVPPFTSLIEKAVDHLGEFGSTQGLNVESMARRDAFDGMRLPAVTFGLAGGVMLAMGLRGLVTNRPFLYSGRWVLFFALAIFLGPMAKLLSLPSTSSQPWHMMDGLPFLFFFLFFPIMAVVLWLQTRGYHAFAATGKSFREGLLAALEKLQLPYEESLSSIRLTSVDAELQVAVQSWMGSGQIKVKPGRHGPLLKKIVQAMEEHFRHATVETNRISCVVYLIFGILILGIVAVPAAIFYGLL